MSTLESPPVAGLLRQLFAQADQDDPAAFERVNAMLKRLPHPPDQRQRAELMRNVYMPVSPDVGRLLYVLARNRGAKVIVEFGTSFGISGIHLAAAVRDAGGGRVVTTELDPTQGSVMLHGIPVGWKEAYLPMLRLLEPRLSAGALIVADDLAIAPEALAPYLEYMRQPGNGYVSVELPLGDRIEVSLRT